MSKSKSDLISLLNLEASQRIPKISSWDDILKIADYSRVAPLLFSKIKGEQKRFDITDEIYLKLEDAYKINLIRNTLILEEFEQICDVLKNNNVPIILLKGIFLLNTVYKNEVALRRMEDVDILIKEEDFKYAGQLLNSLGYQTPDNDEGDRKAFMYFKDYSDNSRLMPLHLHRHIVNISAPLFNLNWSAIDMEEVWQTAQPLKKENSGNIFIMRLDIALLALCEHALRHGFSRLMLLYDIHAFIQQYGSSFDWLALASKARDWGLVIPVYVGLVSCSRIFGTSIPEGFLAKLRPEGISILEKYFMRYIMRANFPQEDRCVLLYLAINRKFTGKIKFILTGLASRLQR